MEPCTFVFRIHYSIPLPSGPKCHELLIDDAIPSAVVLAFVVGSYCEASAQYYELSILCGEAAGEILRGDDLRRWVAARFPTDDQIRSALRRVSTFPPETCERLLIENRARLDKWRQQ
jgi:hypothetical protein